MKKNIFIAASLFGVVSFSFWAGGLNANLNPDVKSTTMPRLSTEDDYKSKLSSNLKTEKTVVTLPKVEYVEPVKKHVKPILSKKEIAPKKSVNKASPYDVLPISEPLEYERLAEVDLSVQGDAHKFDKQAVDGEWAFDTENTMWANFDRANLQYSEMEFLQCRETLCKAEISHENSSAQSVFLEKLVARLESHHGSIEQYEDDSGRLMTRLYRYR